MIWPVFIHLITESSLWPNEVGAIATSVTSVLQILRSWAQDQPASDRARIQSHSTTHLCSLAYSPPWRQYCHTTDVQATWTQLLPKESQPREQNAMGNAERARKLLTNIFRVQSPWLFHWNYVHMWLCISDFKESPEGASLVAQWLRICLLMQGTRVRALVWEDPTCCGATRPVNRNYWACASGACAPQQERTR